MKTFKQFLLAEEAKVQNKHSTHLEDLILDNGKSGTDKVLESLSKIYDKFSSSAKSKDIGVSVKFDGAPAVFFGYNPDPENNRFFVGTKAIFNKVPKINYTEEDIDANHSGELARKLKIALQYLKDITPNNGEMYQGDMMFTTGDLKDIISNGEKMIYCHPNTIAYAVPVDSKMAKIWKSASIGLVVHTRYTGGSIPDMNASFGVSSNEFKNSKHVWIEDAYYKSYDGIVTFTASESKEYNKLLNSANKIASSISSTTYSQLQSPEINLLINTYNNTYIRNNNRHVEPKKKAQDFETYVYAKYEKEIDKRKSEKGKQAQIEKRDAVLSNIPPVSELTKVYKLQELVVEMKEIIMRKLDRVDSLNTFVLTSDGTIKVTGAEGYVGLTSSDIPQGVKLVDRYEFSFNNFSSDIRKGFQTSIGSR